MATKDLAAKPSAAKTDPQDREDPGHQKAEALAKSLSAVKARVSEIVTREMPRADHSGNQRATNVRADHVAKKVVPKAEASAESRSTVPARVSALAAREMLRADRSENQTVTNVRADRVAKKVVPKAETSARNPSVTGEQKDRTVAGRVRKEKNQPTMANLLARQADGAADPEPKVRVKSVRLLSAPERQASDASSVNNRKNQGNRVRTT